MTTWVIQYQKGKTSLDLNEARVDGVLVWHWYQLDHKQTICTSLQTDNYTNIPSLGPNLFHGGKCQISRRFLAKNARFYGNFTEGYLLFFGPPNHLHKAYLRYLKAINVKNVTNGHFTVH